jgi:hypothetical protein
MKAWGSLNSLVTDVQQSKPRDAGKPIAMIEPLSLPASQLPSFNRLLL